MPYGLAGVLTNMQFKLWAFASLSFLHMLFSQTLHAEEIYVCENQFPISTYKENSIKRGSSNFLSNITLVFSNDSLVEVAFVRTLIYSGKVQKKQVVKLHCGSNGSSGLECWSDVLLELTGKKSTPQKMDYDIFKVGYGTANQTKTRIENGTPIGVIYESFRYDDGNGKPNVQFSVVANNTMYCE